MSKEILSISCPSFVCTRKPRLSASEVRRFSKLGLEKQEKKLLHKTSKNIFWSTSCIETQHVELFNLYKLNTSASICTYCVKNICSQDLGKSLWDNVTSLDFSSKKEKAELANGIKYVLNGLPFHKNELHEWQWSKHISSDTKITKSMVTTHCKLGLGLFSFSTLHHMLSAWLFAEISISFRQGLAILFFPCCLFALFCFLLE